MTDRDTFAAAALPLCTRNGRNAEQISASAYTLADAMLRERANHPASTPQVPRKSTNHDAAPAARASKCGGTSHDAVGTGNTQETHTTQGEGTVRNECASVPESERAVAWAVEKKGYPPMFAVFNDWNFACRAAMEEYAEIVPLYRSPPAAAWQLVHDNERLRDEVARMKAKPQTLGAEEVELLREFRDETAQYADEIGLSSSEVRERHRLIDRLLARAGGER